MTLANPARYRKGTKKEERHGRARHEETWRRLGEDLEKTWSGMGLTSGGGSK